MDQNSPGRQKQQRLLRLRPAGGLDDRPWTPIKWREHITGFKLMITSWLREEIQRI